MLLDGSLMVIAAILLTAFHPGWTLGQFWHTATFSLRNKKVVTPEKAQFLTSQNSSQTDLRQSTRYESLPAEGNAIPLNEYGRPVSSDGRYEPYRGQGA